MSNAETAEYVKIAFGAAFQQALEAYEQDEVPVGAVVVKDGVVIAEERNRIVERRDPTAHAELLAIQKAAGVLQNERLNGCELFTTLEPCAMCSGAVILARISAVHFLATDDKLPGLRSVLSLPGHNHVPSIHTYPGLNDEIGSTRLLQRFFKNKRDRKTQSTVSEI